MSDPSLPTTLAAWFHTIDPFLWQIHGSLGIRWYGLSYLLGIVLGWWWLIQLSRRGIARMTEHEVSDFVVSLVIGVIAGGRLGYVLFYRPELFVSFNPDFPWWGVLRLQGGGMSSHGGMLGVAIACWWSARRWKAADPARASLSKLHLCDLVAVTCPLGLCFGRLANFINGELLGKIYALPGQPSPWWTVKFPQELLTSHDAPRNPAQTEALAQLIQRVALPSDDGAAAIERLISIVQHKSAEGHAAIVRALEPLISARVPSQLLQAATDGPLLLLVLWSIWRFRRTPGVITAWFLIAYAIMRLATELWRLPDDNIASPLILHLTRGQWLSVFMIIAGILMIIYARRRAKVLNTTLIRAWGPA